MCTLGREELESTVQQPRPPRRAITNTTLSKVVRVLLTSVASNSSPLQRNILGGFGRAAKIYPVDQLCLDTSMHLDRHIVEEIETGALTWR